MSISEDFVKARQLAACLRRERERVEDEIVHDDAPFADRDALLWLVDHLRREKIRLLEQLADASRTSVRFEALYTTLDRLNAAASRKDVIEAISEVLTGVVGVEELAIFEVDRGGAHLNLLAAIGIEDVRSLEEIGFGEGMVGRVAASGRLFVDAGDAQAALVPWEETLTACIPLKSGGRLTGAIAVFATRLDKFEFDATDLEIFELLTAYAGPAINAEREE